MANTQRTRYGAPPEEKEVVLTFDTRLLFGLLMVILFVVALGGGVVYNRMRNAGNEAAANPAAAGAQPVGAPGNVDMNQARADANALGLPASAQIITNTIREVVETVVPPDQGKLGAPIPGAKITPVDPQQAKLLKDNPAALGLNIPPTRTVADASLWEHDVLANFEDPNVTDAKYAPMRTEDVKAPLKGARIGISDLNHLNTYDFGYVTMSKPTSHDFEVKNVGDADLIIGRIYSGCGCTATHLGNVALDSAGWVVGADGKTKQPYHMKPGQSERFTVQFDPRSENKEGSRAKFIQIFSNDVTRSIYDEADQNSHEIRFRIVVQPKFGVE